MRILKMQSKLTNSVVFIPQIRFEIIFPKKIQKITGSYKIEAWTYCPICLDLKFSQLVLCMFSHYQTKNQHGFLIMALKKHLSKLALFSPFLAYFCTARELHLTNFHVIKLKSPNAVAVKHFAKSYKPGRWSYKQNFIYFLDMTWGFHRMT